MSVEYAAVTGFGFKTDILKTDVMTDSYAKFRKIIWKALPASSRKYFDKPKYFFDDDFSYESLAEAVQALYPSLHVQWYGNPYINDRSGDQLLILVKSTFVRTGRMVDIGIKHKVSASDLRDLQAAHQLLEGVDDPSWRVWLEIS